MKKNLAGLFVAAAMVVSLCACGSGGSGSTTADKTSEAAAGAATEAAAGAAAGGGDAVTLTYVTWNENQRGQIQDTIDGFQKLYRSPHGGSTGRNWRPRQPAEIWPIS